MTNKDLSSIVVHKLATILDSCKNAEKKLKGYLIKSDIKPDLIPELFDMLNSVDDLLNMVNTSNDPYKYFGLPKEATHVKEKTIVFKNIERPEWDFTAWYWEKASMIKESIKELIRYWKLELDSLKLNDGDPFTPREYIIGGLSDSLGYIQSYTQTVFNEVFGDKLEINEK